jgi:hypothetical protein
MDLEKLGFLETIIGYFRKKTIAVPQAPSRAAPIRKVLDIEMFSTGASMVKPRVEKNQIKIAAANAAERDKWRLTIRNHGSVERVKSTGTSMCFITLGS